MADFLLICNSELDNEELLLRQWEELDDWLCRHIVVFSSLFALIEGLSFGSVGSGKDFLAGLQWYFRAAFHDNYGIRVGTVPVSMWRSKVLSKEEQREAKAAGKDGLKKAVVMKLPVEVRTRFAKYVELNKDEINRAKGVKALNSKSQVYQDAMYDLADAFFISKFRLELSTDR